MPRYYSDDPVADFTRLDAEQARELKRLPVCVECDEPIQDEYCFEINGELVCKDCLIRNHKKDTDDYIE